MRTYEMFEALARATWHNIERTTRIRVSLGEDALTSFNLLALASSGTSSVVVEDTRADEDLKGCDFELWIGSDFSGWCRYAIQAKKIRPLRGQYAGLAHKVGKSFQIDILDRYAHANRALPLYCFFNFSAVPGKWSCNLPPDPEQLGCSVTPSAVVRIALRTRGGRSFQFLHSQPETLPWRCLVRCPAIVGKDGPGPAGWPARSTYYHASLPPPLRELRALRHGGLLTDVQGVFNPDVPLRPAWIGVVQIDPPPGPDSGGKSVRHGN